MNAPVVHFSPQPSDESGSSGYASASDEKPAETGVKEKLTQQARETAGQIKSAASAAKQRGIEVAAERKDALADRIGRVSATVRDSARSVEAEDPNIAWITDRAADRLQRMADYVRERDFAGVRADAESFARRHPAAVLGGAFVAGLVIANLLKAGRHLERSESEYETDPDEDTMSETAEPPRPRQASETVVPDDSEQTRESGPVPMGHAGNL